MKMFKKLRLLLSLTAMLVCMCFCCVTVNADEFDFSDMMVEETTASPDDFVTYLDGKVTLTEVKNLVSTYTQQLAALISFSEEELEYLDNIYSSQTDFYGKFAKIANVDLGSFVGNQNVDVKEVKGSDNKLVATTTIITTSKEFTMTLDITVYDNIGIVVTSSDFSDVKSIDEGSAESETGIVADKAESSDMADKMMNALTNTLLGMGTVFVVLILISLIISCFAFIPKIQAWFANKGQKKETVELEANSESVTNSVDVSDDTELVAVIAAAIAASENTTTDGFVVRSIRKRY